MGPLPGCFPLKVKMEFNFKFRKTAETVEVGEVVVEARNYDEAFAKAYNKSWKRFLVKDREYAKEDWYFEEIRPDGDKPKQPSEERPATTLRGVAR